MLIPPRLFLEDGLIEDLVTVQVMPKWEKHNEWNEVQKGSYNAQYCKMFLTWQIEDMDEYLVVFLMQ